MSKTSENDSEDNSSPGTSEIEDSETSQSGDSEYHSGEESEPDRTQIILVNREEEFTFPPTTNPPTHPNQPNIL